MLKNAVHDAAPDVFYWPSSPSSGGGFDNPNDENRGDVHYWDVWHGNKPFTAYRQFYFRFCSEFGFQSFPCMKTVASFATGREQNIFSRVMESHQKNGGANQKILAYLAQTLRMPASFEGMLYASQLLQAEAIRYGVEHWRRNRGRCMGAIYWQLNDCWPVASWSSVDYFGRWKALHYAARRFFAPVLASCVLEGRKARFYVTNDRPEDFAGELVCLLADARGQVLRTERRAVTCPVLSALEVGLMDFTGDFDPAARHPEDDRMVYFTLLDGEGQAVSEGCELFSLPKHFAFQPPRIRWEIAQEADGFRITLDCDAAAWGVCLELSQADGRFSDNWFALLPGRPRAVYLPKDALPRPCPWTRYSASSPCAAFMIWAEGQARSALCTVQRRNIYARQRVRTAGQDDAGGTHFEGDSPLGPSHHYFHADQFRVQHGGHLFRQPDRYLRLRGGGGDFLRHVADTGGGLHVRHGRGYQCEPGPGRPG